MLRWWKLETDPIAKGQLSMLIAHHTTDEDGRRVWELTRNAQFNGHSFVFARLAAISEVRGEVVDRILNDLKQGRYELGDLLVYSKLTDASIRKWLIEEGGRSSDRRVRELSRRLTEKTRQPPAWIRRAHVPPSRDAEVWSTEVDVSTLDQALARAAGQLGIPLRKVGRARTFLAFVDSDEWFVGQLGVRGAKNVWTCGCAQRIATPWKS